MAASQSHLLTTRSARVHSIQLRGARRITPQNVTKRQAESGRGCNNNRGGDDSANGGRVRSGSRFKHRNSKGGSPNDGGNKPTRPECYNCQDCTSLTIKQTFWTPPLHRPPRVPYGGYVGLAHSYLAAGFFVLSAKGYVGCTNWNPLLPGAYEINNLPPERHIKT